MANQPETPVFDAGVLQWETTTSALGGLGGPMNSPLLSLANRTTWLKQEVDKGVVIETATTITVGSGMDYATLQEAWDSLIGTIILAPITIKINDGVYNQTGILLSTQPFAQFIRIEGNVPVPGNVVFNFTPSGGISTGMVCDGVVGLYLTGFRLQGTLSETIRLLKVDGGSKVICQPAKIIMSTANVGLSVEQGYCEMQVADIDNCTIGVVSQFGSHADVQGSTIAGVSQAPGNWGLRALNNGYIQGDNTILTSANAGAATENDGTISCRGSSMNDCDKGALASAGQIICSGATSTNHTSFGFRADDGGILEGRAEGSFGPLVAISTATASQTGYSADSGGVVLAQGAFAINQNMGYQAFSLGVIQAGATLANNSGNNTNYGIGVTGFDATGGGRTINFD